MYRDQRTCASSSQGHDGLQLSMSIHHQRGFNLIEALVAAVVLSMGLLGIAALQLTGMRNTQGSYYRSQAVTLMNDISERIYANTPGMSSYAGFDTSSGATACSSTTAPTACAMSTASTVAACTPAQMAAYDVYAVGCGVNGVTSMLPNGSMQIVCMDAGSPAAAVCPAGPPTRSRLQVVVNWTEQGTVNASAVAADTAQSAAMIIQP